MVTIRHLELAEELFDIEPSVTYPARAAAIVAQLAGAAAHRVVVEGTDAPPSGAEPRGEGEYHRGAFASFKHGERVEPAAVPKPCTAGCNKTMVHVW